MGYMTVVSILNDGWETIKKNKDQFIENIEAGMKSNHSKKFINDYSVGNFANPMEVSKPFHVDMPHIFFVGRNSMTVLTDLSSDDLNEMGFQLKEIKEARQMLSFYEKELEEKLKKKEHSL